MPELRLTLLVVGLIFLVGLAWWELRRPHQVRGSDLPRPGPDPLDRPAERTADWDLPSPSASSRARSPELELPRMSARDPEAELPVVEVGPAEFAAFEARAESAHAAAAHEEPEEPEETTAELVSADFAADFTAPEAQFIDTRFGADFANEFVAEPVAAAPEPPPSPVAVGPETAQLDGLLEELGASQFADPPISDIEVTAGPDGHAPEPVPTVAVAPAAPVPLSTPVAPPTAVVVEWPAAAASQVIAVRVISVGERFSGRAVRLALAAEGFVLGKFEIFHKPAADGRALLSIASLNKPGTFDSHFIDMQRYSGLNLFAVLPGPLPGPAAVDELLACAQILAQRLHAVLQDEQGAPLSPARTAAMHNLAAAAPT
jgi:FtsZ-interacting cell division protein ZipA